MNKLILVAITVMTAAFALISMSCTGSETPPPGLTQQQQAEMAKERKAVDESNLTKEEKLKKSSEIDQKYFKIVEDSFKNKPH